ncbi:MAG: hypothetical protein V7L11_18395 [Nostoc sp.]|uniref:hypothetical protein n=1 Tax=Nostoc sp. TaxID=1180 RepID=UPI002FF77C5F
MATIKINNLNAAGSELFTDSESYLNELTEKELENLFGAGWYIKLDWRSICMSWAWR